MNCMPVVSLHNLILLSSRLIVFINYLAGFFVGGDCWMTARILASLCCLVTRPYEIFLDLGGNINGDFYYSSFANIFEFDCHFRQASRT